MIRDVAPAQAFEMALVENLQREDLNPIEEAAGYERLVAEFGYTQEKLADRVGKERSTSRIRCGCCACPKACAGWSRRGGCRWDTRGRCSAWSRRPRWRSSRAARSPRTCRFARSRRWSGAIARPATAPPARRPGRTGPTANARDLGMRLSRALGTRVDVNEAAPGRGHIAIHYHSLDQLDALLDCIVAPR